MGINLTVYGYVQWCIAFNVVCLDYSDIGGTYSGVCLNLSCTTHVAIMQIQYKSDCHDSYRVSQVIKVNKKIFYFLISV